MLCFETHLGRRLSKSGPGKKRIHFALGAVDEIQAQDVMEETALRSSRVAETQDQPAAGGQEIIGTVDDA